MTECEEKKLNFTAGIFHVHSLTHSLSLSGDGNVYFKKFYLNCA
jgi:hypothetical protein